MTNRRSFGGRISRKHKVDRWRHKYARFNKLRRAIILEKRTHVNVISSEVLLRGRIIVQKLDYIYLSVTRW
jgi:hypothetical protein